MSSKRPKALTNKNVCSLPCEPVPYQFMDVGTDAVRGLSVLVQPSGTRTFRVQYRMKGSPKRLAMTLGRVEALTLDEARDLAREAIRKAAKGECPQGKAQAEDERQGTAGQLSSESSFKRCVAEWVQLEQRIRKENAEASTVATERFFLNSCQPWHDRTIGSITKDEVKALLRGKIKTDKAGKITGRYAARRLFAHLKTLFRWLAKEIKLANPMLDVDSPIKKPKRRERSWFEGRQGDEVIRNLWRYAESIGGDKGKFIKLVLCTGKRRTIVETMRWEQIDNDWFWRPDKGNEIKRNHSIPLPKLVQKILGDHQDKGRVLSKVGPERLAKCIKTDLDMPDFIFHGLRHLVESKLAELRVPPHIRDLLLDHVATRGTGKDYDHWEYFAERKAALELWCAHIKRVIEPAKRPQLSPAVAQRLETAA